MGHRGPAPVPYHVGALLQGCDGHSVHGGRCRSREAGDSKDRVALPAGETATCRHTSECSVSVCVCVHNVFIMCGVYVCGVCMFSWYMYVYTTCIVRT